MIDIVVVAIILFMAVWGYKSGFVKSIFHLGYYFISAIVATIAYPFVTEAIMKTAFAEYVKEKIIVNYLTDSANSTINVSGLPKFLQGAVNEGISNTIDAVATTLTQTVINILSIIIVFLIVRFGLNFVKTVLHKIASLPLLSFFNKTGGLLIGTANGFIIVYIILAVAAFFMSHEFVKLIEGSALTNHLYNNNLLLKFIFH